MDWNTIELQIHDNKELTIKKNNERSLCWSANSAMTKLSRSVSKIDSLTQAVHSTERKKYLLVRYSVVCTSFDSEICSSGLTFHVEAPAQLRHSNAQQMHRDSSCKSHD